MCAAPVTVESEIPLADKKKLVLLYVIGGEADFSSRRKPLGHTSFPVRRHEASHRAAWHAKRKADFALLNLHRKSALQDKDVDGNWFHVVFVEPHGKPALRNKNGG